MKGILNIVKKYMKSPVLYILAIVFTTVQGVSEILLPRFMGDIVNRGIMTGDMDTVYSIGKGMLLVTAILGISGYFAFVLCNITVLKFGNELRVSLYEHVTLLKTDDVRDMGSGSIITRLTGDVEKVISVAKIILDLIYKPLILTLGGFIMIFKINIKFGLVFLSFILIQIILLYIFITKTSPIFMLVQKKVDGINDRLHEILHSMRLIKSSNTEGYEESGFEAANEGLYNKNIEVLSIINFFNPIVMFIMNITIVVIVIMIGYQSHDDGTTIGNVMMSITYAEQILMSIMVSSNLARTISEITPSLKRIIEIEETPVPERGTKNPDSITELTVKNVSVSYVNNKNVLKNVSLTVKSGESVAIVGTTSGGKSTLAKVMAGLVTPDSGEVKAGSVSLSEYVPESLREHIAVVGASNNSIFTGTYKDNLILGRNISREKMEKAAEAAEIAEFLKSTPYGYDSMAYASGNTISGGQRQRLMIARALAADPDVLILDDSTSSLDYATEKKIIDNIRKDYSRVALVLITQRQGSAAGCDRAYTLREGGLS
jgi:ATP-binding cassette subfamily B protein